MSDDRILPGLVWVERGKAAYRLGEQPKRPRLWVVVQGCRQAPRGPRGKLQVTLMNLETGGVRRVNMNTMRRRDRKRAWERWHDPATARGQTEPRGK